LTQLRLWTWGVRQSARLPAWAQVAFGLFLFWPCVVVPRWRLFLGLGALTAAGLSAARWYYELDDLSWGNIAALSTSHVWFPLLILGPLLLPYTLLAGLLVLVAERHRPKHTA
jgi:hypothetical protein